MKINGYNETERGIKSFDTMKPNIEKTLNALKNFKEALDQASIVAITDLDGNITYVNDKFCEISKLKFKKRKINGSQNPINDPCLL